jgi:hypothetical protein
VGRAYLPACDGAAAGVGRVALTAMLAGHSRRISAGL